MMRGFAARCLALEDFNWGLGLRVWGLQLGTLYDLGCAVLRRLEPRHFEFWLSVMGFEAFGVKVLGLEFSLRVEV